MKGNAMRNVPRNESIQRGCEWCLHHGNGTKGGFICPYDECPYHELDNVKTFREYEKSLKGKDILELFIKKICKVSDFVR